MKKKTKTKKARGDSHLTHSGTSPTHPMGDRLNSKQRKINNRIEKILNEEFPEIVETIGYVPDNESRIALLFPLNANIDVIADIVLALADMRKHIVFYHNNSYVLEPSRDTDSFSMIEGNEARRLFAAELLT